VLALLLGACAPAATQAPPPPPTQPPAPAATEPPAPAATEPPAPAATEEPAPAATEEPAPPAPEPITLNFWSGLGSPDNVPMAALVKEFNETNPYGITIEETELDWGTLYSKIVLDTKAGNPPDVLTMHQTNIIQNVSLGILQPVDDLAKEFGLTGDDFVKTAWEGTQVDGKRYAIPLDLHPLGLYYNVDFFEKAGLDPNKPPTNKEEFLEYAKKLTVDENGDGTPEQYGIALGYSGGVPFRTWMSLVWQNEGQHILNEDRTKAAFNTPEAINALQFLYDLVYTQKVSPPGEQDPDDDFMKGHVAMVITGPWAMGDYNKIEGLNYKTAMIPVIYDHPAAWGNSHTFAFPAGVDPAKTRAAMQFVKWMSDRDFEWSKNSGHQPVRISVLESPEFKQLVNWQAFANTLPYAHYYPAIVKQAEVFGREPTSPFVIMMESVMLDQATAADAIATAEQMVNDLLAQP
ncbi:MAG: ABC transporter substrate-binding protein, partial [Anaerolineales bacterium]|nr:ABC transporter substrate-binding protein [Anaerolineales bacterium]